MVKDGRCQDGKQETVMVLGKAMEQRQVRVLAKGLEHLHFGFDRRAVCYAKLLRSLYACARIHTHTHKHTQTHIHTPRVSQMQVISEAAKVPREVR